VRCKILNLVTWRWPRPFQGRFVTDRLGHAMINLPTKFEVPITSPVTEIWKALEDEENGVVCMVMGHPSLSPMSPFGRPCATFWVLFVFNTNYTSILYRLWDIAFVRSKIAVCCYRGCVWRLRRRGSAGTISVKFCTEVRGWLRYTAVKKYCQNVQLLSRMHERHRRQTARQTTDGLAIAKTERNVVTFG